MMRDCGRPSCKRRTPRDRRRSPPRRSHSWSISLIVVRARENWIRSARRRWVAVDRQPRSFGSKLIFRMQSTVIVHRLLNHPPFSIPTGLSFFELPLAQAISTHKTPAIPVQLLACRKMILRTEAVALAAPAHFLECCRHGRNGDEDHQRPYPMAKPTQPRYSCLKARLLIHLYHE